MKKALLATLLITFVSINIGICEANSDEKGAISEGTNGWKKYDNPAVGISFKYPSDIILLKKDDYNIDPEKTHMKVVICNIGETNAPMDLNKEDARRNIEALTGGKFGVEYDFPFPLSKKVKSVGFLFAQDYIVLMRFDMCDVSLERSFLFYYNNKQIIITLYAPINKLKKTMPEYFVVNKEMCGNYKMWNMDKQNEFYKKLVAGNGSKVIQNWYNSFDQICEEIIFAHR